MAVDIEAVLIEHLRENYLPRGTEVRIDPEVDLFDTGILDSAAVLSVVFFIETEFGLTIPDEDLLPENISSVAAATRYITMRLDGSDLARSVGGKHDVVDQEMPDLGSR
ncbi:MAG: phosphopantetheine-binding protein [Planctomycetota bacterium]